MADKESGEDILRAILEKGNKNVKDQVAKILEEQATASKPAKAPKKVGSRKKLGSVVAKIGNSRFFRTPDGKLLDENGTPVSPGLAKAFSKYTPQASEAIQKKETSGAPTRALEREIKRSVELSSSILKAQDTFNHKIPNAFKQVNTVIEHLSQQHELTVRTLMRQQQEFEDKLIEAMTGVKAPTRAGGARSRLSKGVGSSKAALAQRFKTAQDKSKVVRERAERIAAIRFKRNIAKIAGASILGAAAGYAAFKGLEALKGGGNEPIKPYEGPGVAASGSAREAIDFFVGKGWSKDQAIGLAANLQVESNFRTNALGDSGRAYGIAQWHPDRQQIFQKVYNKDIRQSDFKEQLEFVNWELNNNEKRAGARLREAKDAADAAAIIDQFYERSSGAHRAKRVQLAQQYAKGDGLDVKAAVMASTPPSPSAMPKPSGGGTTPAQAAAATAAGTPVKMSAPSGGGQTPAQAAARSQAPAVPMPGPSGGGQTATQAAAGTAQGGSSDNVSMTNTGATRSGHITPYLMGAISQAVKDVYGDGARVEVYSGGQPSYPNGPRTGSTRHDNGMAADVYVYAGGRKIMGDELGRLAQYWLARGLGGVGIEMRGGGIHLDQHTDRARRWFYGAGETANARAMVDAGLRGEMPGGASATAIASAPSGSIPQPGGGMNAALAARSQNQSLVNFLDSIQGRNVVYVHNEMTNVNQIVHRNHVPVGPRQQEFNPLMALAAVGMGRALRLF
jgi:hypothetical protein